MPSTSLNPGQFTLFFRARLGSLMNNLPNPAGRRHMRRRDPFI